MISRTKLMSGGIILMVCFACVLPALALDLNPFSYIVKQPGPEPAITRIAVKPVISAVPVQTLVPVTRVTIPGSRPNVSQAGAVTFPPTQENAPTVLEGVITEVIYYEFQVRYLAVLKVSGTGEEVFLTAHMWEDNPELTIAMWDMLQSAYVKGNLVKVYPGGTVETFEYPTYYGTSQHKMYTIEAIILGPVHPA